MAPAYDDYSLTTPEYDSIDYSTSVALTPAIEEENASLTSEEHGLEYATSTTPLYYYGYYDDDFLFNYDEYYFDIFPFEIYILGYVRPVLVLLTTLMNMFVVGYFLTKKNRGKASNLLFVSIAISDTLTGISLLPNSVYIYVNDLAVLTEAWCNAYMILRFYVCRVFHTVSVWQTLLLAVQRYVCVCHPFVSARVCTFWKTFVAIIVMYVLSAVLHCYHLTTEKISVNNDCQWEAEIPCRETCIYFWFSIALQHLVPALLLVLLTVSTILALMKAQRRVSTIISQKLAASSKRSREKIVTMTTTFIVICFLIPELPHGVYKFVLVTMKHVRPDQHDPNSLFINHVAFSVYEVLLIVSFNANFWIYCAMMNDFRNTLFSVITLGFVKRGVARLRSWSASSARTDMTKGSIGSRSSSVSSRHRINSHTICRLDSTTSEQLHGVRLVSSPISDPGKLEFPTKDYDAQEDDVFM